MKIQLLLSLIFILPLKTQAKTLWSDSGSEKEKAKPKLVKQADDAWDMRGKRRMGIGFSAAGPLGFLGLNLELNFSQKWSLMTGYGGGGGYQSFTFQAKRVLPGEWLMPYMAAGYSRWASTDNNGIRRSSPSFLHDQFINDSEKASGGFSEDIIYPAFGIQYLQLRGPWAGYSVFAEIVLLLDIDDMRTAPTGTIGMLYYF